MGRKGRPDAEYQGEWIDFAMDDNSKYSAGGPEVCGHKKPRGPARHLPFLQPTNSSSPVHTDHYSEMCHETFLLQGHLSGSSCHFLPTILQDLFNWCPGICDSYFLPNHLRNGCHRVNSFECICSCWAHLQDFSVLLRTRSVSLSCPTKL